MRKLKPTNGINQRLHPHDVPDTQFVQMQNYDMGHKGQHDEHFALIRGSVAYHGSSLGTNAATHMCVHYDNANNIAHVLAAVDGKIFRKVSGQNEFEEIFSGLVPNKISSSINVMNRTYLASSVDGILEYDGFTISKVSGSPNLNYIVFSKEINRAFGIDANNPDSYLFTDDVSTMGGVPAIWNPLNADVVPSDEGDIEEALFILRGRLVHLRTNGIWIYYIAGAPTSWRPEKCQVDVGCVSAKTAKLVNNEIWFFGHSTRQGRGMFGFDGTNARILSFDVEPLMYRINPYRIKEACAEYVDNLYKLSFSLDSELQNNHTLHFDTLYNNKEKEIPNVYGVHTYGFESSCVLSTRQFEGEHLFARKQNGGSWVYKVHETYTQYGEIIEGECITPMYEKEAEEIDWDWFKRYERFIISFPPRGTWNIQFEAYKDYEAHPSVTWNLALDGGNLSLEEIILGQQPLEAKEVGFAQKTFSILGRAIQFKIRNSVPNQPSTFSEISYQPRAVRKMVNAQLL